MRNYSFSTVVYFLGVMIIGICIIPLIPIGKKSYALEKSILVSFSMKNCTAKTVEHKVTAVLEASFSTLENLKTVESVSENEFGSIKLSFREDADIELARLEVSAIVRRIWNQLPKTVSYPKISLQKPFVNDGPKNLECWLYGALPNSELMAIAKSKILPGLRSLDGVASVSILGKEDEKFVFEYDGGVLQNTIETEQQIRKALENHFQPEVLGFVRTHHYGKSVSRLVFANNHVRMDESWKSAPVYGFEGGVLPLSKFVELKCQVENKRFRINGKNAIKLVVTADTGANVLLLYNRLKECSSEVSRGLPDGTGLVLKSEQVEDLNTELSRSLILMIYSIVVLLALIFALSRNIRLVSVVLASFLECCFIYILIFFLSGKQLNSMTLSMVSLSMPVLMGFLVVLKLFSFRSKKRGLIMGGYVMVVALPLIVLLHFFSDYIGEELKEFVCSLLYLLPVSFSVSEFFLPSACQIVKVDKGRSVRKKRCFANTYRKLVVILVKNRKICFLVAILLFGIPTFLLPTKIEEDILFAEHYNKLNNEYRTKTIRLFIDNILGGTMKRLVERKSKSSAHSLSNKVNNRIDIKVSMPVGTTFEDMDSTLNKMEQFLNNVYGVACSMTTINSNNLAHIVVDISPEVSGKDSHAHIFDEIVQFAIQIGNATWTVAGLGLYFDNHITKERGNESLKLYGYNYDVLMDYAEALKQKLEKHSRVRNVNISSDSRIGNEYEEHILYPNRRQILLEEVSLTNIYRHMGQEEQSPIGKILLENGREVPVVLGKKHCNVKDSWALLNQMIDMNESPYKVKNLAGKIDKKNIPQRIERKDQEYVLQLSYTFVGSPQLAEFVQNQVLDEFKEELSPGFRVNVPWELGQKHKASSHNFYVLILIFFFIYLICCVILNSFKWPFVVILMVLFSFIGVMGGSSVFDVPLNSGSIASFILVGAVSMMLGLDMISSFRTCLRCTRDSMKAYLKTIDAMFESMIIVLVYGIAVFIPFMILYDKSSFEFSLASCFVGGIIFVAIGVAFFMSTLLVHDKWFREK